MGVAVRNALLGDERSLLAQPLDNDGIRLVGIEPSELARLVGKTPVVVDGHEQRDVELDGYEVVVLAVARCGMDRAGAGVERHVVAVDHGTLEVLANGGGIGEAVELAAFQGNGFAVGTGNDAVGIPARRLGHLLDEVEGHEEVAPVDFDHHVIGIGSQAHRRVGGKRPGRGGPDEHVSVRIDAGSLEDARNRVELELDVDGGRRLVAVLDFGLGEGGMAAFAPMDGLAAPVDRAVEVHLLEYLDVARLVSGREREVRMIPIGVDAEALEAFALHVDVLLGPLAAQAAQGRLVDGGHLVGAERHLDHMLDGLAVAVPPWDVGRIETALGMAFYHEILEDLIERVSDMDRAVRVRGAVVQNEGFAVFVLLEHLPVQVGLLPLRQALRLVFGQIRTHGKIGFGQIHRFLVAVSHAVSSGYRIHSGQRPG